MSDLEALVERPETPTGMLRIAAPVGLGRFHVGPPARDFAAKHPGIQLELRLSDTVEDMVKAGLDLAIRNGPVPGNEASLVARVIARQELVLVAPTYLERAGYPSSLDALMRHLTVRYSRHGRPRGWGVYHRWDDAADRPTNRFHGRSHRDAACEGTGIARLPDWLVAEALRDGRLCRLLPDEPPLVIDTYLVRPATRVPPPRVTMAADHLAATLAQSMKDEARLG